MKKIALAFKNKDIRNRILITLGFLFLFRLGALLTVPGASVNSSNFNSESIFGVLNMLGGGAMQTFSIFALGVSPYITANIIIQLLSTDVIPPLARLKKQGQEGRAKIEKTTRILAIFLSFLQATAITFAFRSGGGGNDFVNFYKLTGNDGLDIFLMICTLVIGSMVTIWIADQITIKGIGNGTSLIIFSGIALSMAQTLWNALNEAITSPTTEEVVKRMTWFIATLIIIGIIIYITSIFNNSLRKMPIEQTGQGLNKGEIKHNFLPVKPNPAGVVPIIFASAFISLPNTIAQFLPQSSPAKWWINDNLTLDTGRSWLGFSLFLVLVFLFSIFYAKININPEETADRLKKQGAFINGIKPGKETENHIKNVVNRLAILGGFFLVVLLLIPKILILLGFPQYINIAGSSLLIAVSVAYETKTQLAARIQSKKYDVDLSASVNIEKVKGFKKIKLKLKDFKESVALKQQEKIKKDSVENIESDQSNNNSENDDSILW